jgi:hypothetical protein
MRNAYAVILIGLTIIFASCKDKNPVEQYGDTLIKTYKNTQQFGDRTSLQNLQESTKAFHAANGRYPNDLKELEGFTGTALDSNKYEYDPSRGTITQKQ